MPRIQLHWDDNVFVPEFTPEWNKCSIYARSTLVQLLSPNHPAYTMLREEPEVRKFWLGPAQAAIRIELSEDRKSGTAYVGE